MAAIFIHKARLEAPSPPEAIAEAFGLTMAELRVLFAIVEVGGVPQVAEVLGIAASTVKTHLGRLYEKTGAARQVDLVKLVAGFSQSPCHLSFRSCAMDELASLSGLIGEIYDATLVPSLWPSVLKRISRFVRAAGAALDCKDAVNNTVSVFYEDGGVEPSLLRLYNDKYGKLDPCAIDHYLAPVGEPRATADILPYDDFLRSRIYRELIKPHGFVDGITTRSTNRGRAWRQ